MEYNKDKTTHNHNLDSILDSSCRYDLANFSLNDCDCDCNLLNDVIGSYGFEEDKSTQFGIKSNIK